MRDTLNKLWAMKPKELRNKVSDVDIINVYLEEFFNTTFQVEKEKSIYDKIDGQLSPEGWALFFKTFSVTKDQHDWWFEELVNLFSKKHKWSKAHTRKSLSWTSLQIGPSVKWD